MRDYSFARQPASPPTEPVMLSRPHPDSELLFAWDSYTAAATAFEVASDEDGKPYETIMDTLADRIERIKARTMEGVEVQLRYVFACHMDTKDAWNSAVHDEDVSEALAAKLEGDCIGRTLWAMIQNAKKAGGAQ
ncbi:hypothetical protein ABNQ39_11390 [Azospirillum sp. A26]|uniref:hypothetical protein n=1 Tax=Azospirillum sp. A26 TaxID=3160607 RepID=UPI00366ED186